MWRFTYLPLWSLHLRYQVYCFQINRCVKREPRLKRRALLVFVSERGSTWLYSLHSPSLPLASAVLALKDSALGIAAASMSLALSSTQRYPFKQEKSFCCDVIRCRLLDWLGTFWWSICVRFFEALWLWIENWFSYQHEVLKMWMQRRQAVRIGLTNFDLFFALSLPCYSWPFPHYCCLWFSQYHPHG